MGTYIPYCFISECDNDFCKGGWDCHPDAVNYEVEALFWRTNIAECCRWSIHHSFNKVLADRGTKPTERKDCKLGDKCYRKNPVHLLEFKHPHDSY